MTGSHWQKHEGTKTGAILHGRALAQTAAVTFDTNTVAVPYRTQLQAKGASR